ncbi:uncharacterized protein LOC131154486 isoform X3 [Malania oleifera]|uniref:uncharacterized protein LOC131154486 isoform X3 n=1 Tax=Malania oleifera TaxID=397392 RepID=UPI0025AE920B|nr:uncharacterized protein LOC131154486 isoform X3 [Malania oleifera]
MEGDQDQRPCPSPAPHPSSSTLLRDISNFKTPKRPFSQNPSHFHSPHPQFFTASKQTPTSSSSSLSFRRRRPSLAPSTARSKAARRLKAFELEQSQSSRKAQIKKERSLKCLSKSLTVWLNFLLENPKSCGCDLPGSNGGDSVSANGKRDSWPAGAVGIDGMWRSPKRQRDCSWRAADLETPEFPNSMFLPLQSSLRDVCSFDDLKQRMRVYLSLGSCKEIFKVMTQVTKNTDDGRLKMKTHCPIVTDVGMKEKAIRVLMCYSPVWLRIGLYIILGGDSLLPNGDVGSEQEIVFLKMVIEKQFFLHAGLAKAYAYNKLVDGLYRPGYFEKLGNVLLKRFLLLVLILDRAKSQGTLPIKHGIDGVDGGSPLLFTRQCNIKSSCQMINELLPTDVMHGEGNLLAHLVMVGYKVSYQQCPLIEYDFSLTDLFDDLRDGVRLCRAIQLLQQDCSILMKVIVPSDTRKKNLINCGIALQYLKQAGVPLYDEDGMMIVGEDLANGDKELMLSLLWNMFVHLQLPILVNKTLLYEEIYKIRGVDADPPNYDTSTYLEMILTWIQAICENYDIQVDNFASLVDGKAMWCLLDYYFRKELHCSSSYKDANEVNGEESIVSVADYTDAVHNFILSQKLTTILGNFPEVLQIGDILEYNGACNERSVIILLVFLSSQLVVKKNKDQLNFHKLLGCNCQSSERKHSSGHQWFLNSRATLNQEETNGHGSEDALRKFKAIQAWWQDMAQRNYKCDKKPATPTPQYALAGKHDIDIQGENAAKIIQSYYRCSIERRNYLKIKNAAYFLQAVIRAFLVMKRIPVIKKINERWKQSEVFRRYIVFIVDRHSFVRLKRSTTLIQQAARTWIRRKQLGGSVLTCDKPSPGLVSAAIVIQTCIRQWIVRSKCIHMVLQNASLMCEEKGQNDLLVKAAVQIQLAWKKHMARKSLCNQNSAATKIQSHFRGWLLQRSFMNQKHAILKIQTEFRCFMCWRAFRKYKIVTMSTVTIQSYIRRWIAQRRAQRLRYLIVKVQGHCRGWLTRREYLLQKKAAIKIQRALRCLKCWEAFHCYRYAAIEIQRFIRGQITRHRLLGASSHFVATHGDCILGSPGECFQSYQFKIFLHSVLKLQMWWRGVLLLKAKTKSAIIIQSYIRGWIGKQEAYKRRHHIVQIQSYWKGYLMRKQSREQLLDLRLRMRKSAANVDDDKRIINRLLVALSELLSMRSVSSILHTCATLDMATEHSQKCCEELVAAGAIDTLVKLIRSVSRSIPDQEVLKHALSTLKNIARYPHLVEVLIDTHGGIETVLWQLLRNKGDGYFIASELLKKICLKQKGVVAVRNLPGLLKRLHNLVEDLTRRTNIEKRNSRGVAAIAAKGNTERRLREALDLFKLTTNG